MFRHLKTKTDVIPASLVIDRQINRAQPMSSSTLFRRLNSQISAASSSTDLHHPKHKTHQPGSSPLFRRLNTTRNLLNRDSSAASTPIHSYRHKRQKDASDVSIRMKTRHPSPQLNPA